MLPARLLLKAVVLGDAGVGKTSLLNQYIKKSFTLQYKATVGADFLTKEIKIGSTIVTLQLWDTAGTEKFHSIGTGFYRNTDCCILVFDLTNTASFEKIDDWKEEFLRQLNPKNPEQFPFIILGNKNDKTNEINVTQEKIDKYINNPNHGHNLKYFSVSAKENVNVDEAFLEVANYGFKKHQEETEDIGAIPRAVITTKKEEEKKGCCS